MPAGPSSSDDEMIGEAAPPLPGARHTRLLPTSLLQIRPWVSIAVAHESPDMPVENPTYAQLCATSVPALQ
jgi:hypothetical protein